MHVFVQQFDQFPALTCLLKKISKKWCWSLHDYAASLSYSLLIAHPKLPYRLLNSSESQTGCVHTHTHTHNHLLIYSLTHSFTHLHTNTQCRPSIDCLGWCCCLCRFFACEGIVLPCAGRFLFKFAGGRASFLLQGKWNLPTYLPFLRG